MTGESRNSKDAQMTALIAVLDEIKSYAADELDSVPSSDQANSFLEKLDQVYLDPTFRHSYSVLSMNLGTYKAEERDSIPVILAKVTELAENREKNETNDRIQKSIQKLLDHVELECLRLNRMDELRNLAQQSKVQQEEAAKTTKKVSDETTILESKVKGFHEQSITILGIFSAVVIAFTAEISMFTKGFESLTPDNVYAILFYCVIVGMIVFDTLFMLIFFIAKIAGCSLAVGKRIKTTGLWIIRTFSNYPYIYLFNGICLILAVIMFYANKH